MQNHFRIAGGLEDVTPALQVPPDGTGVYQISVVRQGHLALITTHLEGLGVLQVCITGGGVACVPDGQISGQGFEDLGGKDFVHVAHAPLAGQGLTIGNGDAGAFLPAMLQRVETVVGKLGSIRMSENAEHAAIMFGIILLLHRPRR